jgi:hypothetical protein
VARAEADAAKAQRARKKRVTKEAATVESAAKVVQKKRKVAGQKHVRATVSRAARRPRVFRVQTPAPATLPAISAPESSDGSETFLMGQSDLS